MTIRRPFTPKGSSEKKAVLSNRNHNIPLYASIGEILDNSIEWGASEIQIVLDWKSEPEDQPEKIIFIDNGIGMNPDKLSNSLVTGFHEDEKNNSEKIGKFGVGCTYAFLSNCRKAEVYSKEKSGEWYYTLFDIDSLDLDDPSKNYPPDAELRNPPKEYEEIWSELDSGTVTIWSNFDKGRLNADPSEIPFWISRAYRKFIGEKVVSTKETANDEYESVVEDNKSPLKIYYNGNLLKAYDPLYAIPYREDDKEGGDLYNPLVIHYPRPDGEGVSEIIVQFGLSPEKWRQYISKSAKDPINVNERRIRTRSNKIPDFVDSRKLSIIRNGREVSWLHDHWLLGRINDLDRWFGIEIIYDSELDDVFNVKNVKYQVGLSSEIRSKIKEEIVSTVATLRTEVSDVFEADKNRNNAEKIKKEKASKEKGGTTVTDYINPKVEGVGDSTDEPVEKIATKIILNKEEREKIISNLAKRSFVTHDNHEKRIPKDTNLLFEFYSHGSKVIMERYMNHPWFSSLRRSQEDFGYLIENGDGVTIEDIEAHYHEIESMWEIFLQTLVISMATLVPEGIQQKYLDKLLSRWGKLMTETVEEYEEGLD